MLNIDFFLVVGDLTGLSASEALPVDPSLRMVWKMDSPEDFVRKIDPPDVLAVAGRGVRVGVVCGEKLLLPSRSVRGDVGGDMAVG